MPSRCGLLLGWGPEAGHTGGMDNATVAILVAAISAAVALTGLVWQLALFRLGGPRLQVRLRPAILDEHCVLHQGPERGWGDGPPPSLTSKVARLHVELADIKVVNIGRSPVRVEGIGLDFGRSSWRGGRHSAVPRPIKTIGASAKTELRLDPGDSVSVFADFWRIAKPQQERNPRSPLVVRGTATRAGRRSTLSPKRKRWAIQPEQDRLASHVRSDPETRAFQQLWRMLPQHEDGSSGAASAWRMVKPIVADPSATTAQVTDKLSEVLGGPQDYVALEVLAAYRGLVSLDQPPQSDQPIVEGREADGQ